MLTKGDRGMRKINLIILLSAILNIYIINANLANLKSIDHHQAWMSDKIICHFDNEPTCIYEPIGESRRIKNRGQACFFMPLCEFKNKINNFKKEDYSIYFEPVTKPVPGIKIHIEYDPKKVSFEQNRSNSISDIKTITFQFFSKKALNKFNNKTSVLRWCAMGKHQPRIVIDSEHNTGPLAKKISDLLKSYNCEVFLINKYNLNLDISNCVKSGYANLIINADLFIGLYSNNLENDEHISIYDYSANKPVINYFDSSKSEKKLVSKFISLLDARNKQLFNHAKNYLKLYNIVDKFCNKTLNTVLALEVPSLLINLNENIIESKDIQNAISKAIVLSLKKYFESH